MALEAIDINYLFGSLATFLSITAVMAGASFQTFIKWWDKWQNGQPIPFDRKFLGTAAAAIFGALIIAIPVQAEASERIESLTSTYGLIVAWVLTAAWAYALNNGINGIVTKLEQRGENNLMKSDRLQKLINNAVDERLNSDGAQNNTPDGVISTGENK